MVHNVVDHCLHALNILPMSLKIQHAVETLPTQEQSVAAKITQGWAAAGKSMKPSLKAFGMGPKGIRKVGATHYVK